MLLSWTLAFVVPCVNPAFAAAPALSAAAPALPPDAVAVWRELDQVRQLRASFEQTQYRSVLSRPLVSKGTLAFARPNRVRWEVSGPVRSVFVLDGAKVSSALPDLGHTETIDLSSSPEAARLVEGLMVWLGGDLEQVSRDYALAWRSGPPHVAELTPKNPMLAKMLARITLTIEGAPPQVTRVVLLEPSGDRVEIALSAFELDAPLPDGTFSLP